MSDEEKMAERLEALATDWGGSKMTDGEPIRDFLTAGDARKAAALIRRLEAENAALVQEVCDKCDSISVWRAKAMAFEEVVNNYKGRGTTYYRGFTDGEQSILRKLNSILKESE